MGTNLRSAQNLGDNTGKSASGRRRVVMTRLNGNVTLICAGTVCATALITGKGLIRP